MLATEQLFGIIFISFLTAMSSFTAGIVLLTSIMKYDTYLKEKFGDLVPEKILKNGYQLSLFAFAIGLFFLYRIGYVVSLSKDFSITDWFVYDIAIGVYMLLNNFFLLMLFTERRKMEDKHKV